MADAQVDDGRSLIDAGVIDAEVDAGDLGGTAAAPDDIQRLSYEAARDALLGVVDELERGGTTLERSLALWERGEALAARCETWLTGARARLDAARSAEA